MNEFALRNGGFPLIMLQIGEKSEERALNRNILAKHLEYPIFIAETEHTSDVANALDIAVSLGKRAAVAIEIDGDIDDAAKHLREEIGTERLNLHTIYFVLNRKIFLQHKLSLFMMGGNRILEWLPSDAPDRELELINALNYCVKPDAKKVEMEELVSEDSQKPSIAYGGFMTKSVLIDEPQGTWAGESIASYTVFGKRKRNEFFGTPLDSDIQA